MTAAPEATGRRARLLSLDVFRGLTVAGMLLVNDPGSWTAVYPPLEHAEWNGWTPTDLVFPFFLFIVGITTHLSLASARKSGASQRELVIKIIRRGLLIVFFGLLLNAFPFFWWGKMAGFPNPTFLQRVAWRFSHLRFAGVLQRIGLVYIASAIIALRCGHRARIAFILGILGGYWILMTLVPVPGSGTIGAFTLDQPPRTLAAWSDRLILGPSHIWSATKTWDPEGPLSTLPAIGTALLGVLAGEWITASGIQLTERIAGLYAGGSIGILTGSLISPFFPINKNLWTSSYVVFTGGLAAATLATCMWLIDFKGWSRWSAPFAAFGMNPLIAFLGSGLMARLIDSLIKFDEPGGKVSLHELTYSWMQTPWLSDRFTSLLWGLLFVTFWWVILSLLRRRGVVLKV